MAKGKGKGKSQEAAKKKTANDLIKRWMEEPEVIERLAKHTKCDGVKIATENIFNNLVNDFCHKLDAELDGWRKDCKNEDPFKVRPTAFDLLMSTCLTPLL